MIKVLHTSDWHIGKQLYRVSLDSELLLFFDWLIDYIQKEKITHLIVSGDIYDLANPSNASRSIYFDVLRRLIALQIKVIITAGNHDSVGQLEAAKEILEMLNIYIIASPDPEFNKQLIPVVEESGKVKLVICAVPFLRETHLRKSVPAQNTEDRLTALNDSLLAHFASLSQKAKQQYGPEVALIAMGHLHLVGADVSDSEREIQIGNLSGIDQTRLEDMFDFMALGHIHRPKSMSQGRLVYSGSPIPLSFSEKADKKRIVIYDFDNHGALQMNSVQVPVNRRLIKLTGSFDSLSKEVSNFNNVLPLEAFFELEFVETDFDVSLLAEINDFVMNFDNPDIRILSHKTRFINQVEENHLLYLEGKNLVDLSPKEVLQNKLSSENIPDEMQKPLLDVFEQLLEEYYESENSDFPG